MLIDSSKLQIISDHKPEIREEHSLMRAAVAVILRDNVLPDGRVTTEFLMMQRAIHDRDPWSGQMSFPGGKIEVDDVDARAAAIREAEEEVGVALQDQDYIGRLDDLYGLKADGVYTVHIACFVFKVTSKVQISANYEVADTVWLPVSYLNDPSNYHEHLHPKDLTTRISAVMINADKNQVLWGLSLRILVGLYEMLNLSMDVLTTNDRIELKNMEKRNIDRSKLSKKILDEIDRRKR